MLVCYSAEGTQSPLQVDAVSEHVHQLICQWAVVHNIVGRGGRGREIEL